MTKLTRPRELENMRPESGARRDSETVGMIRVFDYRIYTSVAIGLFAIACLTASTGSGIEESFRAHHTLAPAEVAASTIPGSRPGALSSPGDIATKKSQFLQRLLPHIQEENDRVASDRARLIALASKASIGTADRAFLQGLAAEYRITVPRSDDALLEALLRRVDKIPPSLVLAQAAIESAWGTSRFARDGNNLFGQWCMREGCGIVPSDREDDATHEVRRFASVQDSVHGYFMNINTNRAYRPLWTLRSCQRTQGQVLSGARLAEGLSDYAEIGDQYVESVRRIIRVNRWDSLDRASAQLTLNHYGNVDCDQVEIAAQSMVAAGE